LTVRVAGRRQAPPLIDGISLGINQGEMVCVVGESGSGKSGTALSIMGLLPRRELVAGGAILVGGEDVLTASPRRLRATRMAMVFQEPTTAQPCRACR
jgi:peptide/nickel transport system ATP-binding protein